MPLITFEAERHEYRDAKGVLVPSVTSILKAAGLVDDRYYTDFGRERGSAVHEATALYDRDDLDEDSIDPRIAGYLAAWRSFRVTSGFVPDSIEQIVYHQTHRYAGTFDRTGRIGERKLIVDIKTGPMLPVTGLQLAAYQQCVVGLPDRIGVEIRADGTFRVTEFKDRLDWQVFQSALAVAKWKENKK